MISRLQVELVDSRNGNIIWRQTYQKKVSGLVVLQSELARDLVGKLSVPITDKTREKLAKRDTENSDANRLYLSGVFHARKLTEQDIKKAIELFWQAIHKDPEYARAYAAMASAHRSLTMCCDGHPSELAEGKRRRVESSGTRRLNWRKGTALSLRSFIRTIGTGRKRRKNFCARWNWTQTVRWRIFRMVTSLDQWGERDEAARPKRPRPELEPFEPFFNARVGSR